MARSKRAGKLALKKKNVVVGAGVSNCSLKPVQVPFYVDGVLQQPLQPISASQPTALSQPMEPLSSLHKSPLSLPQQPLSRECLQYRRKCLRAALKSLPRDAPVSARKTLRKSLYELSVSEAQLPKPVKIVIGSSLF